MTKTHSKSIKDQIHTFALMQEGPISLQDFYEAFPGELQHTIRARVYEGLGKLFNRVSKGVYMAISPSGNKALIVEGDGRDLSEIPDNFIDALITDHPWEDKASHVGGSRNFVTGYQEECFRYGLDDFKEKFRVLKDGAFLVENLPEENANNFEYLYQIKKMAMEAGFRYFAQVPWVKGTQKNNTGRKSKNREMLLFMSKGKPRALRADKQRGEGRMMSGTSQMLPIEFNFQPKKAKEKTHKAEKPVELYAAIIDMVSRPGEVILDQFAGSLNIVLAALNKNRNVIAYEKSEDYAANGAKKVIEALEIEVDSPRVLSLDDEVNNAG